MMKESQNKIILFLKLILLLCSVSILVFIYFLNRDISIQNTVIDYVQALEGRSLNRDYWHTYLNGKKLLTLAVAQFVIITLFLYFSTLEIGKRSYGFLINRLYMLTDYLFEVFSGGFTYYINKQQKIAFISTIVSGMVAHSYRAFNLILCNDSIVESASAAVYDGSRLFYLRADSTGRTLDPFFEALAYSFHTPVVCLVIAILAIAISAMYIIDILQIRNDLAAVVVGALLIVFPAMIYNMSMTSIAYPICIMLNSVAASKLIRKHYFSSVIILFIALHIYPMYVSCYLMLVISRLILDVSKDRVDIISVRNQAGVSFLSAIVFFVSVKLILFFTDAPITDYQGADKAIQMQGIIFGNFSSKIDVSLDRFSRMFSMEIMTTPNIRIFGCLSLVLLGLLSAYTIHNSEIDDKKPFPESNTITIAYIALFYLIILQNLHPLLFHKGKYGHLLYYFLMIICVSVLILFTIRRNKAALKALVFCVLFTLIPLSLSALTFLSEIVSYHAWHRYAQVYVFTLVVALGDFIIERKKNLQTEKALFVITHFICIMLIYGFIMFDNIGYYNADFVIKKDTAFMTRVMSELENRSDFTYDSPVYYIPIWTEDYDFGTSPVQGDYYLYKTILPDADSVLTSSSRFQDFAYLFMGLKLQSPSQDQIRAINIKDYEKKYSDIKSGEFYIEKENDVFVIIARQRMATWTTVG